MSSSTVMNEEMIQPSQTSEMSFAIVLVNFNGLEDTIECLQSISEIESRNVETIVVDNASSENQAEVIVEQFEWATVISSPDNTGWSGGNNIGIGWAFRRQRIGNVVVREGSRALEQPADVVFLLNNDTVVSPNIIDDLRAAFSTGFDIVGPVINEYDDRGRIQSAGVQFNRPEHDGLFFEFHVDLESPDNVSEFDIINGCAIAIHRRVVDSIGMIDDRFFLIGEESDFCLRSRAAGFSAGVLHKSLVFHKHSVSFNRAGKPLQRYYGTRNLWLLLTRHCGKGRRGPIRSRCKFFLHTFHVYCHERDLGNAEGAEGVMIGVADAMLGRFGKRTIEPNWLSRLLGRMAGLGWRLNPKPSVRST